VHGNFTITDIFMERLTHVQTVYQAPLQVPGDKANPDLATFTQDYKGCYSTLGVVGKNLQR
jgi:hypothetical protein